MFTRADGTPLHPDYVSQRFRLVVDRSRLPPIRLHDLRHGAPTLAHAAGADLRSIGIAADLYTNVLSATQHWALAATARLLRHSTEPRRRKDGRKQHQ